MTLLNFVRLQALCTILLIVGCSSSAQTGDQDISNTVTEPGLAESDWTETLTPVSRANEKMVGGTRARSGEWPYLGTIRGTTSRQTTHFCGATMISPHWALTAAHCVPDLYKDANGDISRPSFGRLDLVVGVSDLSQTDTKNIFKIVEVVVPPDYRASNDAPTLSNFRGPKSDIALVRFDGTWNGPVARLSNGASSDPDQYFGRGFVAGFGLEYASSSIVPFIYARSGRDGYAGSQYMQHAMVPMKSPDACSATFSGMAYDPSDQICAGFDDGGIDSCQGDSGGPMAALDEKGRAYQVGVVSFGFGCAEAGWPGVYTRISNHVAWVLSHVPDAKFVSANPETAISVSQDSLLAIYSLFDQSKDNIQITTIPAGTISVGQEMRISVTSKIGGRLWVLDKGADGTITPIYPNRFIDARDTLVSPRQTVLIPDESYQHKFRFTANLSNPSVSSEKNEIFAIVLPPSVELIGDSMPEMNKTIGVRAQSTDYALRLQKQITSASRTSSDLENWSSGRAQYEIIK